MSDTDLACMTSHSYFIVGLLRTQDGASHPLGDTFKKSVVSEHLSKLFRIQRSRVNISLT